MPAQKSHKRSAEETRSRKAREEERGKRRQADQHRRAQANLLARKLPAKDVADMQARRERGEEYRTIGRAYGLDEFTVARVLRYGRLTPWQAARSARAAQRRPLQDAWAKRHPAGKES